MTDSLQGSYLGRIAAFTLSLSIAVEAAAQNNPMPVVEDVSELDLEELLQAPVVESASKRRQSLEEAPGSMTVIDGKEVAEAGAVTLADALRLVPGLWVYQTDANMFHVGMRGTGRMESVSVLVLVNGRRFADVTVGYVPWSALPVHVGEIERIEILRGPGATLYGADAFNGVINIVTKHPLDGRAVEGAVSTGVSMLPANRANGQRVRLNNGANGYLAANVKNSSGTLAARGFVSANQLPEWQDLGDRPDSDVYRNGHMGYHLGVTADWLPRNDLELWLDARHAQSERQMSFPGTPATTQWIAEQSAATGLEKKRFVFDALTLKVNADTWRQRQQGQPLGLDNLALTVSGYHLLVQTDLSLWDGRNILTAGLDGAVRTGDFNWSIGFTQLYGAALLQNEVALFDRRLLLNVAGRLERISSRSDQGVEASYENFNPRLSAILRLGHMHTLRASAATSYRVPTPFQAFADVLPDRGYQAPVPPAYAVLGNPRLLPEQMRAGELGYRGRLAYWLRLDVTAFVQHASDLLQASQSALPFQTQNELDEDLAGLELGAQLRSSASLSGYFNYAFQRSRSHDADRGIVRFPRQLLSTGVRATLFSTLLARADFSFVDRVKHEVVEVNSLFGSLREVPRQEILNLRLGRALDSLPGELFLMGTNVLAPWRERRQLLQYSNSTAAPIGMVVILGVEVRNP